MPQLERAIYITKVPDLKYWKPRFTRLYFGNEFCEMLIPSRQELTEVLKFVRRRKLNFSLLTCQVNDFSLTKFPPLFSLLRKKEEIILNDWGIYRIIKKDFKYLLPHCALGKLLLNNISLLPDYFQDFLEKLDLCEKRLEAGVFSIFLSMSSGAKIKIPPKFKISVYYPYACVAFARFCPNTDYDIEKFTPYNFTCSKNCQKYTCVVDNPKKSHEKLFLRGNAWFQKKSLPSIRKMKNFLPNIDRLVYMPVFPIG